MDALDVRILRTMGTVPYVPRPKDPDAFKTSHKGELQEDEAVATEWKDEPDE